MQLGVVAFSLGDITIQGNEHLSDTNIRYSLPDLAEGMTPNTARFVRSLNLANRHPGKQVAINLKQSSKPDAIDTIVSVEDRRPWQVFMSANNIGSEASGRSRFSVGAQYITFGGFFDVSGIGEFFGVGDCHVLAQAILGNRGQTTMIVRVQNAASN